MRFRATGRLGSRSGVMMTLEHDGEHRCDDAARSNAKDRSRLSFRSDQGIREASATVAPAGTGPILALQRAYGNRAVKRLLHGNNAHSGTVERRVLNLQRQPVPVVPAVGLALSGPALLPPIGQREPTPSEITTLASVTLAINLDPESRPSCGPPSSSSTLRRALAALLPPSRSYFDTTGRI